MQYCSIPALCLIGEISDPYYQKHNFDSLFNRPKLRLSFPTPSSRGKFQKKLLVLLSIFFATAFHHRLF